MIQYAQRTRRTGLPLTIHRFSTVIYAQGDILSRGREAHIELKVQNVKQGLPLENIPHFSIGSAGGMAFPEVLRTYAKLFNDAAEFVENGCIPKPPIDFQI